MMKTTANVCLLCLTPRWLHKDFLLTLLICAICLQLNIVVVFLLLAFIFQTTVNYWCGLDWENPPRCKVLNKYPVCLLRVKLLLLPYNGTTALILVRFFHLTCMKWDLQTAIICFSLRNWIFTCHMLAWDNVGDICASLKMATFCLNVCFT